MVFFAVFLIVKRKGKLKEEIGQGDEMHNGLHHLHKAKINCIILLVIYL